MDVGTWLASVQGAKSFNQAIKEANTLLPRPLSKATWYRYRAQGKLVPEHTVALLRALGVLEWPLSRQDSEATATQGQASENAAETNLTLTSA